MNDERFRLERSKDRPKWWVLTDTVNLVVIRFKDRDFEGAQEIVLLNEDEMMEDPDCANKLARILTEMGDWLTENHLSVAVKLPVFDFVEDENECKDILLRNAFPRFSLHIEEQCSNVQLARALRAAAEFLLKKGG